MRSSGERTEYTSASRYNRIAFHIVLQECSKLVDLFVSARALRDRKEARRCQIEKKGLVILRRRLDRTPFHVALRVPALGVDHFLHELNHAFIVGVSLLFVTAPRHPFEIKRKAYPEEPEKNTEQIWFSGAHKVTGNEFKKQNADTQEWAHIAGNTVREIRNRTPFGM